MLLILDDIQVGCGCIGIFFSFDNVGIKLDIIILFKLFSGYGLLFVVVLLKLELDQWKFGEYNGIFCGYNLVFVIVVKVLEYFWSDDIFVKEVQKKGDLIMEWFCDIVFGYDDYWFYLNGCGMMQGLVCCDGEMVEEIIKVVFKCKLVIEIFGVDDQVIKILCLLIVIEDEFNYVMDVLKESVEEVMKDCIKCGDVYFVFSLVG